VFAIAANKVGVEWVGGPIDNFGESCVVGPDGELIACDSRRRPGLARELDLGSSRHPKALPYSSTPADLFPLQGVL